MGTAIHCQMLSALGVKLITNIHLVLRIKKGRTINLLALYAFKTWTAKLLPLLQHRRISNIQIKSKILTPHAVKAYL